MIGHGASCEVRDTLIWDALQERGLKNSSHNLGGADFDITSLANWAVKCSCTPVLLLLAMGTSFVWFFQGTSVLTFSLAFLFLAGNSHRKSVFFSVSRCDVDCCPLVMIPPNASSLKTEIQRGVSSCFLLASSCGGDAWACRSH